MARRPTTTLRNQNPETRAPVTFARAEAVCPDAQIAASLSRRFGLDLVDYDAVRGAHRDAFRRMAAAFGNTLGEKAAGMHFQRLVAALVGSAFNAGSFYTQKVTEARDLTTKLENDHRDEDHKGGFGFESRAQRARHFAAKMGLQAYAQLAAADGALAAYTEITGETWKPYEASTETSQSVDRQVAAAELTAFGNN